MPGKPVKIRTFKPDSENQTEFKFDSESEVTVSSHPGPKSTTRLARPQSKSDDHDDDSQLNGGNSTHSVEITARRRCSGLTEAAMTPGPRENIKSLILETGSKNSKQQRQCLLRQFFWRSPDCKSDSGKRCWCCAKQSSAALSFAEEWRERMGVSL